MNPSHTEKLPTPEPIENRKVVLYLTHRWAGIVMALLRKEIRKCHQNISKRPFTPEPGHYDSNAMRISAMTDMLKQLGPQYARLATARKCEFWFNHTNTGSVLMKGNFAATPHDAKALQRRLEIANGANEWKELPSEAE